MCLNITIAASIDSINVTAMTVLISLFCRPCMTLVDGSARADCTPTSLLIGTTSTLPSRTLRVIFSELLFVSRFIDHRQNLSLADIHLDQFGDLIYNTDLLNETEVPSIFGELINPVWKSKLALTYPNDDDAITYLFSIIIENYGWEWFDTLLQQNIQWIRGTGQPADLISQTNTTRALSFTTNLNGAENLASKTPSDARVLWPQTGGIFATTSRPESAKLFMSWLVSDEYQQQFVDTGSYTVRKDLESTSGSVWDDKVTPLTQFATFMENRDLVEWWRLQFETSIGTAQGLSPVLSEYGRRTTL